jgi:predicted DNA-binding antitoxin AbrB/MazE fold protein
MHHQIDVIYENGVLRPLGPLPDQLHERQRYTITIDTHGAREARLDAACVAAAKRDADPTVSLEEVRQILAKVPGTLAEAVSAERGVLSRCGQNVATSVSLVS